MSSTPADRRWHRWSALFGVILLAHAVNAAPRRSKKKHAAPSVLDSTSPAAPSSAAPPSSPPVPPPPPASPTPLPSSSIASPPVSTMSSQSAVSTPVPTLQAQTSQIEPSPRSAPTPVSKDLPAHGAPSAPAPTPASEPKLAIGAGLILYGYHPFANAFKNNIEVYFANLLLDGSFDPFGFHVEPRLRDTPLRPFFAGPAWIEEAYVQVRFGSIALKAGKVYSRLGLFWDNSFYGNIPSFDGLKLDPDNGLSLEGWWGERTGVAGWLQFFPVDGRTNISFQGRDTISIPGAFRRNQAIVLIEPYVRFGQTTIVKVGLSGESLRADLPAGGQDVLRGSGDLVLTIGGLSLWGELLYQRGRTVSDFPYPGTGATATTPAVAGRASAHNRYALAGLEFTYRGITARYNHSRVQYADVGVGEWMHQPGLGAAFNANLSILGEYVIWKRTAPEGTSIVDQSLNLTLYGHL